MSMLEYNEESIGSDDDTQVNDSGHWRRDRVQGFLTAGRPIWNFAAISPPEVSQVLPWKGISFRYS